MKLASLKPSLIFFAIFTSIFFLSCTSENETDSFGFMTADIENVQFTSKIGSDYVYANKSVSTNTTVLIQGETIDGMLIQLIVINYTGPGNYSLNFSADALGSEGILLDLNRRYTTNVRAGGTGNITITSENDSEISGTFQFLAPNERDLTDARTISNGKFTARVKDF
jgi:hypothetical protein